MCGGTNLRERKRVRASSASKTRFVCETQTNRRLCRAEFEEAPLVQPVPLQTAAFLRGQEIRRSFRHVYEECELDLYRNAAVLAIRQFQRYMRGDDTATFCKPCAFLWDKEGQWLCVGCRDGWHPIRSSQCTACATGQRYVTCSKCGRARHLDKYPTCYNCAFDQGLAGAT